MVTGRLKMRAMTADYHKLPRIDTGPAIPRRARRSSLPIFLPFQLQENEIPVIFFFSSGVFLAYDTVPEELIYPAIARILLGTAVFALIVPSTIADMFPTSGPVVSGKRARLYSGQAAAPKKAPAAVKRAIWAANQLCSKPYQYGGGHRSFDDHGYDCSGTVSYALGAAGLIRSPMSSREFRKYGRRGRGKWITIYARKGHTFAVIAGLRLDTTPNDNYTGRWAPAWQTTDRSPHGFVARHPVGL
jgi:hypothetical protein